MGVQGLWTLLSPAGRKLKIEALEGQKLAVDVSIWIIRMLYGFASRKQNSEFQNIHLVGIFKRLCRLLSLGIKPVFVFDGKAPDLKRHTLYLRQQQREKRQINLQKLAEKYVIKQLEGKLKDGQVIKGNNNNSGSKGKEMNDDFDDDDLDSLNSDEMNEFEKNLNDFQTQIIDVEYQQILKQKKKYPKILDDILSNEEEFYIYDIASKISIVQKVNQRLLEIRNSDLSKITDMEEFSKLQSKSYVEYVIQKREVMQVRDEGRKNLQAQQFNYLIDEASTSMNDKQKDSLLNDQNNKITTGWMNSDRDKMFLFVQKNIEKDNINSNDKDKKDQLEQNKIGLITKPIRKSKQEKRQEIQQRLSDLLKARETEVISWQKQQKMQSEDEDETKDQSNKNIPRNRINRVISKIDIIEDNESFFNEQSVNFDNLLSNSNGLNKETSIANNQDYNSDLSFGSDDDNDQDQKQQQQQQEQEDIHEFEEKLTQEQEQNQLQATNSISYDINRKLSIQNELDQAMIQSDSQLSFSDDIQQHFVNHNSSNWSQSQNKINNNNSLSQMNQNKMEECSQNTFANTQKRISDIVKKDQINNYEILKSKAIESQQLYDSQKQNKSNNNVSKADSNRILESDELKDDSILKGLNLDEIKTIPSINLNKNVQFQLPKDKEKKSNEEEINIQKKQSMKNEQNKNNEITTEEEIILVKNMFDNQQRKNRNNQMTQNQTQNQDKEKQIQKENEEDIYLQQQRSNQKKKEREEFDKLLQKLKLEEQINNMTEEERKKYLLKNPQIKLHRDEQREQKQSQLLIDENENTNDDDEEIEEDPEEIKKLLQQVERWEEEQNKHVNDGIDLTDEQLEEEFQRFINLNELDSESIQDKFQQVRQLLLLFGVPWVEAPSEAEAQCAYLEQIKLVDGIITDDSDVFLFGGKNIYRGLFGKDAQYVRYVNGEQIERDLGVDRQKLIYMAMFLGSDYTLGIKGVGIVNAMEIVTAFENIDALKRFKIWASKADVLFEDPSVHYKNISLKEKNYKELHKNYKKHWEIHDDFPSQKVIDAYLQPNVDKSEEQFQWGKPSIGLLKTYCQSIFGWNDELINYILKPLEDYLKQEQQNQQMKITDYYKHASKFAIINSNRLKNAIKDLKDNENGKYEERLQQEQRIENIFTGINRQHQNNLDKKRKTVKNKQTKSGSGAVNIQEDDDDEEDQNEIDLKNKGNNKNQDCDDDSHDHDEQFDNNLNSFQFNKNNKKKKPFFKKNIF